MPPDPPPQARLTTIARFRATSFLEHLAVRGDGSALVTSTTARI